MKTQTFLETGRCTTIGAPAPKSPASKPISDRATAPRATPFGLGDRELLEDATTIPPCTGRMTLEARGSS